MHAKGKWSASTTTEVTCAFPALRRSSRPQSPPSRPPRSTPALWATRRRETAVWVGVWFVGLGVDRWPQDGWSLSMFVCVWLSKFIDGSHRLRGTGGRSRCWDGRLRVGAKCVGVSEYESTGGRQTLEEFGRFHTRTAAVLLRIWLEARSRLALEDNEVFIRDSKHDSTWCDVLSCRVHMRGRESPSSALQQSHCAFQFNDEWLD